MSQLGNIGFVEQRQKLQKYKNYLHSMKVKLAEGERLNEEREKLEKKVRHAKAVQQNLITLSSANKMLLDKALAEDMAFKNRRLEFISSNATEFLNELFPERGFRVEIVCDFDRGFSSKLRFYDRWGQERLVHMSEGKFLQSLLSFGSSVSMAISMMASKLYLDEAFAVSDPENLVEISKLVRKLPESGVVQLFMIEQTSVAYKDLPRREIHLFFDPILEQVLEPEIYDYEGEMVDDE